MKLDRITFATSSAGKVREASKILNMPLDIAEVEIDEIQEMDPEKIVMDKLDKAYALVKKPVIVDDISVEIEAWGGFPGPLIKWLLETGGGELLIKMLAGSNNRRAKAKLAIGFTDGKNKHVFYGEIKGNVASEVRGDNGFGWDPIFIPDGQTKTFAQMSTEEKNEISHRRIALDKLSDFLKANYEV